MSGGQYANPYCMHMLNKTVQALALPANEQLKLYPDGSAKADELALDFDQWHSCAVGNDADSMTQAQLGSLRAIDEALSRMSGYSNPDLWTEQALGQDVEWEQVRELARAALAAFGWPNDVPADYEAPYPPDAC